MQKPGYSKSVLFYCFAFNYTHYSRKRPYTTDNLAGLLDKHIWEVTPPGAIIARGHSALLRSSFFSWLLLVVSSEHDASQFLDIFDCQKLASYNTCIN